jgi:hypothetical protein
MNEPDHLPLDRDTVKATLIVDAALLAGLGFGLPYLLREAGPHVTRETAEPCLNPT